MMSRCVILLVLSPLLGLLTTAGAYNPQPAPADLVLPMPQGDSMVFRPIFLGVGSSSVACKQFQLAAPTGEAQAAPTTVTIGGTFQAISRGQRDWVYYLGKYEVTEAQYAAIMALDHRETHTRHVPIRDISWFDALAFTHKYNLWLFTHANEALPRQEEAVGYVRLPTEIEWEFAARGGIEVAPAQFHRLPSDPGDLGRSERLAGGPTAPAQVQPVGRLQPNPLHLHDMLGNVSELTMSLYHTGYVQGRVGGWVARGGNYTTPAAALRQELPWYEYDATGGQPYRSPTVGLRLAIAAVLFTSPGTARALDEAWQEDQTCQGGPDAPLTAPEPPAPAPRDVPSPTPYALVFRSVLPQAQDELDERPLEPTVSVSYRGKRIESGHPLQLPAGESPDPALFALRSDAFALLKRPSPPRRWLEAVGQTIMGLFKPEQHWIDVDDQTITFVLRPTSVSVTKLVFYPYVQQGERKVLAATRCRYFLVGDSLAPEEAEIALTQRFLGGLQESPGVMAPPDKAHVRVPIGQDVHVRIANGTERCHNRVVRLPIRRYLSPRQDVDPHAPEESGALAFPVQTEHLHNSIGMEFVLIPAGTFIMGSPDSVPDAYRDEKPAHEVTVSEPFYMGKYEVTQAQWKAVMGNNPSRFKGDTLPVENVTWDYVQEFIKELNNKEGKEVCRLPTEAQWEYAARVGTTTRYSFGDDPAQLGEYAWYHENSGGETHPVGEKKPNKWDLYDMHGNVWEWVEDWYAEDYYKHSPKVDPQGPNAGAYRVHRGGSWAYVARDARSAYRDRYLPGYRSGDLGFRCLSSASSQ